jgi:uncharacterized protein (TIGR03083 family)
MDANNTTTKALLKHHLTDQIEDLAALADSFTDVQWDAPSLCAGWKVRDVISHMTVGGIYSPLSILTKGPKYRFSIPVMSDVFSREWGATHSGPELAQEFRRVRIEHPKRFSIGAVTPTGEVLVDHITHEQDMRVPLDLPRPAPVPGDRMLAALDVLPTIKSYGPKRHVAGLRLEATDYEWSWGQGPVIRGPALAIVLAVGGRPKGLESLDGDGVDTLRSRIAA